MLDQARLLLIHDTLSEDITDITRVWPLQLKTKDSRFVDRKNTYCCDNILTFCPQIAEGAVGEGEGVLRAGAA